MVGINLLPWREQEKKYQRRTIKKLVCIFFMVPFFSMLMLHFALSKRIAAWQLIRLDLNQQLQTISTRYPELSNNEFTASLSAQNTPKRGQSLHLMMQLLAMLGSTLSQGTCFTEVMAHENQMILQGRTVSAIALTDFLTHWDTAHLFSEIKLESLNKNAEEHDMHFRLIAKRAA